MRTRRIDYDVDEVIEMLDTIDISNENELMHKMMMLGAIPINNMKIIKKIIEKKAFFLLSYCTGEAVINKIDGKSIFEIMIENSVKIRITMINELKELAKEMEFLKSNELFADIFGKELIDPNQVIKEAISILYKKGSLEELALLTDEGLLTIEVEENKMLIEAILAQNIEVKFYGEIRNPKIIKVFIDNKKTKYYKKFDPYALFEKYDDNNTLMDIIMEQKEKDNSIGIRMPSTTTRIKAKIIIEYVRHGFKQEIGLRIFQLFDKNSSARKNLLDFLLDEDRELTLTKIISPKAMEHPHIKVGILLHDLKGNVFTAGNIKERFEKGKLEEYRKMPVTEEQEQLLNRLREVLNDGKSNTPQVEMLVLNYRRLFAENNPCACEVQHIIDMKEKDGSFSITAASPQQGNSYSTFLNTIAIDGKNVKAFNHEIGHALFERVSHRHIPQEFVEIIERIRNDSTHLQKVYEHSQEYQRAQAEVREQVNTLIEEEFKQYITPEKISSIDKFLKAELELDSTEIEKIFGTSFKVSVEEFIKREKAIKRKECERLIFENTYYNLTSISDILDAIYKGKYRDNKLVFNNKIIPGYWGHGEKYFMSGTEIIFNEILADYSRIIKSPNPQEGIQVLTYYVGAELVDFLHRYYQENILDAAINEYENDCERENERKFRI